MTHDKFGPREESMTKLLDLAEYVYQMKSWLPSFAVPDANGMFCAPGTYPREGSVRFIRWLKANFEQHDIVGALMLLRHFGIHFTIFVYDDIQETVDFRDEVWEDMAKAMGGRTGRGHSGRAFSKVPNTDKVD